MKKDDQIFIYDILESISRIQQYTKNHAKNDFLASGELQDAIVRRFEIIGEATNHISEEMKENNSKIPWHKLVGMRNIMIHEYSRVDLDLTWEIIKKDLPKLKKQIQKISKSLFRNCF